jgi:hypothetical protein
MAGTPGDFTPEPLCYLCRKNRESDLEYDEPSYAGFWQDLCSECRFDQHVLAWASWTEWEELLGGNLHYLKGRIDSAPYSDGPPKYESDEMDELWRLQAYGLLVVYCGVRDAYGPEYSDQRKTWHQFRQRPWMEFMIPTLHEKIHVDKINHLVDELLAHEDIVTTVFSEYDEYPHLPADVHLKSVAPFTQLIDAFVKEEKLKDMTYYFRTSSGPIPHVIMQTRDVRKRHEIKNCPWETQMEFPMASVNAATEYITMGVNEDHKYKMKAAMYQRVLCVQMAVKEWDSTIDLQALLEGLCDKVGMRKVFSIEDMERLVVKPGQKVWSYHVDEGGEE